MPITWPSWREWRALVTWPAGAPGGEHDRALGRHVAIVHHETHQPGGGLLLGGMLERPAPDEGLGRLSSLTIHGIAAA